MKRIAAVLGCMALIGVVVWALSLSGLVTAGDATGGQDVSGPATYVCAKGCDHHPGGCPGDSTHCQGQCKDCKNHENCKSCKDCKGFKDANGDGKCDSAGQCEKHGESHEKSRCPHHSPPAAL